jgi:hypothetical protein
MEEVLVRLCMPGVRAPCFRDHLHESWDTRPKILKFEALWSSWAAIIGRGGEGNGRIGRRRAH